MPWHRFGQKRRQVGALQRGARVVHLKTEDRGKLRSDVVRREAGNTSKQRQCAAAIVCACPVVTLLVREGHPLIPLVLDVPREKIAASATRSKPPCIAGRGLIVSPIDPDFVRKLYEVRAMLDGLAARLAAERGAERAKIEGPAYLDAGRAAVASGSLNEQIEADMNFHAFINALSENSLIGETTAPH